MSEFDALIGKTVTAVATGDDGAYLRFTTADGKSIDYVAEGDCCSRSWFNHLSGVDALIGYQVTVLQEKDLSGVIIPPAEMVDDCVLLYGWTFVTERGYVDLEMRNASNGYYGGYATKLSSHPRESVDWKPVTVDF